MDSSSHLAFLLSAVLGSGSGFADPRHDVYVESETFSCAVPSLSLFRKSCEGFD